MKTIFILEPDKLLAKNIGHILQKKDRQIVLFRTASVAIRALEKVIPDLVIMELALPGHNGFEFIYEMVSYSDSQNVKIIVNSFVRESSVPWGFINRDDMGIVEYLPKQFTHASILAEVVNEHI
jgi:two-component SAPR family response regulator